MPTERYSQKFFKEREKQKETVKANKLLAIKWRNVCNVYVLNTVA
jgi:hypothetical protein